MKGYAVFGENNYNGHYVTLRPPFRSFGEALNVIRGNNAYETYHIQAVGGAELPFSYRGESSVSTILDSDLEVMQW
jgi:hypothetical protein